MTELLKMLYRRRNHELVSRLFDWAIIERINKDRPLSRHGIRAINIDIRNWSKK